ncbi:hypothetical protein BBUCA112A_H0009 (plasmid) [Borreliella burgdorferi CA-11.2A]|nr:hypothetical protein BBU64B_H0012 [Borreliella burgdorferi 64b]ACN56229.1 hypothetical protein BBUCA112A_H0009 [Borreliella burgdorferi CA-11.2A]
MRKTYSTLLGPLPTLNPIFLKKFILFVDILVIYIIIN